MPENKNKGNSKQPPNPEIGIFESVESRFSPENKDTMDKKTLLVNKNSTSGIKRSKSPPSSPSLRQSKLSEESFSPKKKPTTMCGCPRQELTLHYDTPLYCSVQLRKSLLNPDPKIKDFTENQMNSLQALKEEDFHQAYLNTVTSFMSQCRKPPPALVFYMLHSILLEKKNSCATECSRILRQIQVLHPAVPARMVAQKITWEYINSMIAKMSADSCLAANASMALAFLISVMEEEVDIKKTFSLVKTSAYRLLSVTHFTRICDVIQWIGQAIEQHASQCSRGCGHNICPVHLLQRMLMLSLSISERPEDCASRIADELFLVYNWQLLSIEHKTLLLQSMKSHLLRIKLIEVILSNCCPSQVEQENVKIPTRSGLRHIFFDFMRSPPIYDAECADTTVSCEEFIMLLAYFLQSFIFCRKRSLRKNTSDSLRIMSMDDGEVLLELDKEVLKLRERLESFCSPSPLSSRSYQLLDLMLSLKSFAKKLP